MPKPKSIVIAESDTLVRESLTFAFVRAGYRAHAAADGDAVVQIMESGRIDVLLLDVQVNLKNGVETLIKIHEQHPGLTVFLMSGAVHEADPYFVKLALKFGVNGVIRKPISPDTVVQIVSDEIIAPVSANVA